MSACVRIVHQGARTKVGSGWCTEECTGFPINREVVVLMALLRISVDVDVALIVSESYWAGGAMGESLVRYDRVLAFSVRLTLQ